MPLSIPHTFTQKTKAKASEVNDNFDAILGWANDLALGEGEGNLLLADLESGSPGQLIVCNSSGVPQYRTGGGSVSVDSSGNFSQKYYSNPSGITGLTSGVATPVGGFSLPSAGTWLVIAKASIQTVSELFVNLKITGGGGDVDQSDGTGATSDGGQAGRVTLTCMGVTTQTSLLLMATHVGTGANAYNVQCIGLRLA